MRKPSQPAQTLHIRESSFGKATDFVAAPDSSQKMEDRPKETDATLNFDASSGGN